MSNFALAYKAAEIPAPSGWTAQGNSTGWPPQGGTFYGQAQGNSTFYTAQNLGLQAQGNQ